MRKLAIDLNELKAVAGGFIEGPVVGVTVGLIEGPVVGVTVGLIEGPVVGKAPDLPAAGL